METGIHELTAGYALDALEPEERRAYEAHLEGCEQCREELAAFWQTTEALAVAASGPAPSGELRERILSQARQEPQVVVPLASRRRRTVPVLAAAAGVAAVVALALGLWAAGLSSDLDDTRAALERERAAAAVLADPGARSVALQPGAATDGRLVVDPDGNAVLVVNDLGPAPAGQIYQLWIVPHGGEAASAGLSQGADGVDVIPVEGTVDEGEVVAVTVENAGGVDAPTTDPILGSLPV
ncbi:MAG TPA: anti-sigma factor [Gaiellaceae bacterium]|nr:anti-sigma factor [Gaiellaceae bacterium]